MTTKAKSFMALKKQSIKTEATTTTTYSLVKLVH